MSGMSYIIPPIHKEGYIFVAIGVLITLISSIFSSEVAIFFLLLTCFVAYFFRNPDRETPEGDNLVISPADGRLLAVEEDQSLPLEISDEEEENEKYYKVSIFLSVLDVHVNRVPASGNILKSVYRPGKFFNASLDKASEHNERQSILMQSNQGHKVGFIQIAGLIARRIVCDIKEGDIVNSGEVYGIIRFGSRAEIFLPMSAYDITVKPKQTMIGGETVIAKLK